MDQLAGKVAVVTGAASGIGRALALELARSGCELAVSDVAEDRLAETRALCEATGDRLPAPGRGRHPPPAPPSAGVYLYSRITCPYDHV